eukprot:5411250-Prymnesium_polylepis.1
MGSRGVAWDHVGSRGVTRESRGPHGSRAPRPWASAARGDAARSADVRAGERWRAVEATDCLARQPGRPGGRWFETRRAARREGVAH